LYVKKHRGGKSPPTMVPIPGHLRFKKVFVSRIRGKRGAFDEMGGKRITINNTEKPLSRGVYGGRPPRITQNLLRGRKKFFH